MKEPSRKEPSGKEPSGKKTSDQGEIPRLIREKVATWGMHPYDINDGRCTRFAEEIVEESESGTVWTLGTDQFEQFVGPTELPNHVWVFKKGISGGKHFDAEQPKGVEDVRMLPIFLRAGCSESPPEVF
jgi:hypothetical protein